METREPDEGRGLVPRPLGGICLCSRVQGGLRLRFW